MEEFWFLALNFLLNLLLSDTTDILFLSFENKWNLKSGFFDFLDVYCRKQQFVLSFYWSLFILIRTIFQNNAIKTGFSCKNQWTCHPTISSIVVSLLTTRGRVFRKETRFVIILSSRIDSTSNWLKFETKLLQIYLIIPQLCNLISKTTQNFENWNGCTMHMEWI